VVAWVGEKDAHDARADRVGRALILVVSPVGRGCFDDRAEVFGSLIKAAA
jgi:hypothetical protein